MTVCSWKQKMYVGTRFLLVALLASSLLVMGCASKYGTQTTKVAHYPDCYAPINEMRQSEFTVGKATATGAVIGGILGAAIGYLATGKASGAVVGGAAGATVGGATGYYKGSKDQEQNDQARLGQYNSQLDGGIREMDKATAGARLARQCYERQFGVAVSEYKAGHLTKPQFNSRYLEASSGMAEAANILGLANKNSAQMVAEYNKAIDQEAAQLGVARPTGRKASASSGSKSAALTQVAEKNVNMERAGYEGQKEERLLRERLAAMNQTANDLMS